MKLEAKHAEESLDRLKYILDSAMKPSLEKAKKASTDPSSEAIQQRSLMIVDIEKAYDASMALVQKNAEALNDISRFIEGMRKNILLHDDKMGQELFKEQAEMLTNMLEPLIKWHDINVKDYLTRKKGD